MAFVTEEKIQNWFIYHEPQPDQILKYKAIRDMGGELAMTINANCPESPEKTTAINKIREAVMWANAAIACNEE